MRAIVYFAAILLFLRPAFAQSPPVSALDETVQIRVQVLDLLQQHNFNQLNSVALGYRTTGALTATGIPKLGLLYAAFDKIPLGEPLNARKWPAVFDLFEAWQKNNPSITAAIVLARLHLRYAWQVHGPDTPTADGQKAFIEHLQATRAVLEANKPYSGTDPDWQWVMALLIQAEGPNAIAPDAPLTIARQPIDESDEESAEFSIKSQARFLFEQSNFHGLNLLAEFDRTHDAKTPAGLDRLNYFYRGLEEYAGLQTPSLTDKPNEEAWKTMFARTQAWIDKDPSPAAIVAMAKLRVAYAWAWRGDGYASTIPPANIKPFHNNLKIAYDFLLQHKAQASVDPEWYAEIVTLAGAGVRINDKEVSALVTEGLTRYRYYYPLYAALAQNITPWWGGSWEAVEAFATFAAQNTKDKLGMGMYARVYQRLNCYCEQMTGNERDWRKMKQGLQDIATRYPVNWNYNRYAAYACQAQDKKAAREALAKMSGPRASAWGNDDRLYPLCKSWTSS
jgi:hypothetical protein